MRLFQSAKTTLGLDIGSHTVKAVRLTRKDHSQPELTHLGIARIGALHTNSPQAIKNAVAAALASCNLKKLPVVTAVGGSAVTIKQVFFPSSSPKEIESALRWEAGRYIPLPADNVSLEFQIRSVSEDAKSADLLLAAVERDHLQNHLNILGDLQIEPKIVDAAPLALANACLTLGSAEADRTVVIIEIGASTTYIIIVRAKGLFFCRDISVAGNRFTEEIQRHYHLDQTQAEGLKAGENFDPGVVEPALDQLLLEIRQSLLYFDTKTGNKGYDHILLTGGGAKMSGLASYLEKSLSMPIIYFEPLEKVKIAEPIPLATLQAARLQLGVAIGLALRG